MIKTAGVIISILGTLFIGGVGFGKLQSNQTKTEETVKEVKVVVKENTEKINTNENKNIEHAVIIQRTVAMLDKLEERFNSREK